MPLSYTRKIDIGFFIAIILICSVVSSVYASFTQMNHQKERVEHTYEVISTLGRVLSDLVDMQSAVRGYAIAGSPDYITSYYVGLPRVQKDIAALPQLVRDNPKQYERSLTLKDHVDERLSNVNGTIRLYQEEGQQKVFDKIRTGNGKREMDEIRAIITEMTAEEKKLLDTRRAAVEDFTKLTLFAGITGVAICVAILLTVFSLIHRELSLRIKTEALLKEQSIRDPLTKLYNRRYLDETFARELSRMERNNKKLCVLIMDIDHFKKVNDTYGHDAGDAVLVAFAEMLSQKGRKEDITCRLGGEEFVLVLPDAPLSLGQTRAEEICAATRTLCVKDHGYAIPVTVSVGVSLYPNHGTTVEKLLDHADQSMYKAKRDGRNRVIVYGDDVAAAGKTQSG